jgi:hypothetical protein
MSKQFRDDPLSAMKKKFQVDGVSGDTALMNYAALASERLHAAPNPRCTQPKPVIKGSIRLDTQQNRIHVWRRRVSPSRLVLEDLSERLDHLARRGSTERTDGAILPEMLILLN